MPTGQSLDSYCVTDSALSVTNLAEMAMFYIKMTILSLKEVPVSPTGQFKESLGSFYYTDSPLSVTNIPQMAMFCLN